MWSGNHSHCLPETHISAWIQKSCPTSCLFAIYKLTHIFIDRFEWFCDEINYIQGVKSWKVRTIMESTFTHPGTPTAPHSHVDFLLTNLATTQSLEKVVSSGDKETKTKLSKFSWKRIGEQKIFQCPLPIEYATSLNRVISRGSVTDSEQWAVTLTHHWPNNEKSGKNHPNSKTYIPPKKCPDQFRWRSDKSFYDCLTCKLREAKMIWFLYRYLERTNKFQAKLSQLLSVL